MKKFLLFLILILVLLVGSGVFLISSLSNPTPATEITAGNTASGQQPGDGGTVQGQNENNGTGGETTPPAEKISLLHRLFRALSSTSSNSKVLPIHGIVVVFFFPLFVIGIPWVVLEIFLIRYTQPIGIDLSKVKIKSQDGLFIEAIISLTARRTITLASTRMNWPRVRDFVEKDIEQELVHRAANFPTLEILEQNLKNITQEFMQLQVVKELSKDFGVSVMRFNIEPRYPSETKEALKRKADASAGGVAYLAYTTAADLKPNSPESRELYKVYQETSSQVDAARNLGGSLTGLAGLFGKPREVEVFEANDSGE